MSRDPRYARDYVIKARSTRTEVRHQVLNDGSAKPWRLTCLDHGVTVSFAEGGSYYALRSHPERWCLVCMRHTPSTLR